MNIKRAVLRFNINEAIPLIYCILVFYTPGPIVLKTIIYKVTATPYIGEYGWLGYSYSALALFALLVGIRFLFKKKNTDINIGPLVLYLVIWNLIRLFIGASTIFQYHDYSLFLSLITGFGGYIILKRFAHVSIENAFDLIIILNFITQLANVIAGRQLDYGGRFAAIGSTTGSIGVMCASYILYYLFCKRSDSRSFVALISAILSLLLSGSRYNLMIAVVFIIIFAFKLRKGLELNQKKKKTITILLIASIIVIPFAISYLGSTIFSTLLNRAEDVIGAVFARNTAYVTDDLSFNARLISMQAGLKTIAENPLGLSTSSIDLQAQTIKHGFAYFPHSTLISYYLLWGPPSIIIFCILIKNAWDAFKTGNNTWILLLYFIASFVLYGSPIIEAKTYLWYLLMFDYIKNELFNQKSSIIEETNGNTIIEKG